MPIKTFLVDGGLPRSGRSLATLILADLYQSGQNYSYGSVRDFVPDPPARVYVWDAANDPGMDTGYQIWHERGMATVHAGRIGTEEGMLAYMRVSNLALEASQTEEVRFIIDLPAIQDSQMLLDALKPELLEELNLFPVWTLTRHPMSLALLTDRTQVFGDLWRKQGVVLRNTWFSRAQDFSEWEASPARTYLTGPCGWLDLRMFCLSDWLLGLLQEQNALHYPLNIASEKALQDQLWLHVWRFSLELFRGNSLKELRFIERPHEAPLTMEARTQKQEAYAWFISKGGRRDQWEEAFPDEYREATLLVDRMGLKDDDPFWWHIAFSTVRLPTVADHRRLEALIRIVQSLKTADLVTAVAAVKFIERAARVSERILQMDTMAGWIARNVTDGEMVGYPLMLIGLAFIAGELCRAVIG